MEECGTITFNQFLVNYKGKNQINLNFFLDKAINEATKNAKKNFHCSLRVADVVSSFFKPKIIKLIYGTKK